LDENRQKHFRKKLDLPKFGWSLLIIDDIMDESILIDGCIKVDDCSYWFVMCVACCVIHEKTEKLLY
jgi:hypothetical protein